MYRKNQSDRVEIDSERLRYLVDYHKAAWELTHSEIAGGAGLSASRLSFLMQGKANLTNSLSIEEAERLASHLGVEVDELERLDVRLSHQISVGPTFLLDEPHFARALILEQDAIRLEHRAVSWGDDWGELSAAARQSRGTAEKLLRFEVYFRSER